MNNPLQAPSLQSPSKVKDFTLWGIATLRLPLQTLDEHRYELAIPQHRREAFDGDEQVSFTFGAIVEDSEVERVDCDSHLFQWICGQLAGLGPAVHAAPVGDPASVREITPALFGAYRVDGGTVRLSGCSLEPRPFLRLTYRDASSAEKLAHVVLSPDGRPVDAKTRADLHLDRLQPLVGRPPPLEVEAMQSWIAASDKTARQTLEPGEGDGNGSRKRNSAWSLLTATVIWCRRAVGKLSLEIEGRSVEQPFDGWARDFADGKQKPAPYACPLSGISSHHLAATDDGRLAVSGAIEACAESGKRVLKSELEACEDTGARVLPAFMARCPVTERRVIKSKMGVCDLCHERVSRSALSDDLCSGCRSLSPIFKDDARLAQVLGEHPKLDAWRKWRLAETSQVFVMTAATWFQRLLLVVERESLQVKRLATGGRLLGGWSDVDEQRRGDFL